MKSVVLVLALAGCGRVDFNEALDLTDTVANLGFARGTHEGTRIRGDVVALEEGDTAGVFRSRIFDAGQAVDWTRIEWAPLAPYGVALPDDGRAESYREGGIDMRDNILLLHADVDATVEVGGTLVDSSGRDHDPIVVGAPIGVGDGVFGNGFNDSLASRLEIPLSDPRHATDFSFGTGDWTWALWLATPFPCTGSDSLANDTYLGVDDNRSIGGEHLWFGCLRPTDSACPAQGASQGRLGGTLISISNAGPSEGGSYCGTEAITDGPAHLLAITKTGHAPATIETWVDNVKDFSGPISFGAPFEFTDGKPFNIAGEPGPRQGAGVFDEVAIWRRALSPDELRAIYLRGVRRLEVKVRACDLPDCSDGRFGEPLVDPGHLAIASRPIDLLGRYFQYELTLAGIAAEDGSPELDRVQVFAAPL